MFFCPEELGEDMLFGKEEKRGEGVVFDFFRNAISFFFPILRFGDVDLVS